MTATDTFSEHHAGSARGGLVIERGAGGRFFDELGAGYVDHVLGGGAISIGHTAGAVFTAVAEQMSKGILFSGRARIEAKLAHKLSELLPSGEMSCFFVGGSAGVTAAVRLARALTGRSLVLFGGYHGWHDWSNPSLPGVPSSVAADAVPAILTLQTLTQACAGYAERLAAVVFEPSIHLDAPDELKAMVAHAQETGALVIFDEVRTGFRIHLGGAQALLGLKPDLSIASKALSNGFPLCALLGRREAMREAQRVGLCRATYQSHLPSLAAAVATLDVLEQRRGPEHLAALGRYLQTGINRTLADLNFPGRMVGPPAMLQLQISPQESSLVRRFYTELMRQRVHARPFHPWYLCLEHTEMDLDETIAAVARAAACAREVTS